VASSRIPLYGALSLSLVWEGGGLWTADLSEKRGKFIDSNKFFGSSKTCQPCSSKIGSSN
jgi:hypothetical protein